MNTIDPHASNDSKRREEWLLHKVLEYLFDNAATGAFGSLAVVLLVTFGIYGHAPTHLVVAWGAAAIVIALIRFALLMIYRKQQMPLKNIWMAYRVMVLVSGVLIGYGCWLFVPLIPSEFQFMFFAAVLGISGGGIAIYAADHFAYQLFMFPSCILATATLFYDGSEAFLLMAVLFMFFMVVMFQASKQATSTFLENTTLSYSLHYKATHDSLTGLLNREAFENYYDLRAPKTKHGIALIFIDLDNFKQLNDTYGHKAGDDALVYVGSVIQSSIRSDDHAARLGGDEFVALLFLDDLTVAEKASETIRKQVHDYEVKPGEQLNPALGCSIGIAFSAKSHVSYQTLMNRADKACYASKDRGKNQYTVDRVN